MSDKEYYENLLYLNSERIKVSTGKERFVGVKVLKYLSLIKSLRFVRTFKELNHDIYAFIKKDVVFYIFSNRPALTALSLCSLPRLGEDP